MVDLHARYTLPYVVIARVMVYKGYRAKHRAPPTNYSMPIMHAHTYHTGGWPHAPSYELVGIIILSKTCTVLYQNLVGVISHLDTCTCL